MAPPENDNFEALKKLCSVLGNVTIIQKGKEDIISNGIQGECIILIMFDIHNSQKVLMNAV